MIPRNWWNVISRSEADQAQAITLFLKDVYNILNRGILLKDNVKGALLGVTFSTANADIEIRHGLDFVPSNYIVVGTSAAMSIYDGVTSGDRSFFYLRSSAVGTARVFIF